MAKDRQSKQKPHNETPEEWFERILAEARQYGLDENIFRLGFEVGKLLHASPSTEKKAAAGSFLRRLDQLDPESYLTLVKLANEYVLNNLLRLARRKELSEHERAVELVLAEVSLLGISDLCCDLKATTERALRYRLACLHLTELEQDDPAAAKDLADAGLMWLREDAKKRGIHGIVAAVEEIGRLSDGIYDNYYRLASPRPQ